MNPPATRAETFQPRRMQSLGLSSLYCQWPDVSDSDNDSIDANRAVCLYLTHRLTRELLMSCMHETAGFIRQ